MAIIAEYSGPWSLKRIHRVMAFHHDPATDYLDSATDYTAKIILRDYYPTLSIVKPFSMFASVFAGLAIHVHTRAACQCAFTQHMHSISTVEPLTRRG